MGYLRGLRHAAACFALMFLLFFLAGCGSDAPDPMEEEPVVLDDSADADPVSDEVAGCAFYGIFSGKDEGRAINFTDSSVIVYVNPEMESGWQFFSGDAIDMGFSKNMDREYCSSASWQLSTDKLDADVVLWPFDEEFTLHDIGMMEDGWAQSEYDGVQYGWYEYGKHNGVWSYAVFVASPGTPFKADVMVSGEGISEGFSVKGFAAALIDAMEFVNSEKRVDL